MVVAGAVEVEVLLAWLTNKEQALDMTEAGYLLKTAGVDKDAELTVTAARLSMMLAVVVVVLKAVLVTIGVTNAVGVTVATRAL